MAFVLADVNEITRELKFELKRLPELNPEAARKPVEFARCTNVGNEFWVCSTGSSS
jgi:hypothetical protein